MSNIEKLACRFAVLAVICVLAFLSRAATYCDWKGVDGGDFWDSKNWVNGIVPNTSDRVARFNVANAVPGTVVITNSPGGSFGYIYCSSGGWRLKLVGTHCFGGDYDNGGLRVTGVGTSVTIEGGTITNTCFVSENGGQLVFDNCVTRSCLTHRRLNSSLSDPDAYVFNGGKHDFRTMYMRLYQKAVFNGGDFSFGSIHGYDRYGEGKQCKLSSFICVSGGRLSVTGENKLDHPASIGITVNGNGWYKNYVEHGGHWLADRGTYVWRVEDKALIETPGIYLAVNYDSTTGRIEVAGGRFHIKSSIGGNDLSDKNRGASVVLDGGVLDCDFSKNTAFTGSKSNQTSYFHLCVGVNGGRIRNRNGIILTIDNNGFMNKPGVAEPGVLTIDGYGKFYFNQAAQGAFTGRTKIRGYVHSDMSTCPLGTGDIEIADGGILYTSGKAVNNSVTYSGASYIWTDNATGCMTIPSLTQKDDGILILRSTASRTVYGTEADSRYLCVETAPELRSNGIPVESVILMSSESDNGIVEAHLVNWDAERKRFVGAAYTTDILNGAGKVVYQNGATNMTDDVSVGALVLRGVVAGGHKSVTVGDGEGPAMVVLNPNSRGSGADVSNWTLRFGTARGVISGGTKVSGVDNGCPKWNGYINGSGGVDFAFADTGGIILYRKQSWTGGTRVMSGEVLLMSSGSYIAGFPDEDVVVVGGERSGGSVRFMAAATHAQNYTISGFGAAYSCATKRGALSIEKDVTLAGDITLANDALIGVTNGFTGTLTGGITGTGDLYLGSPVRTGAFVLSGGIDIDGDLHVNTCVTNSGAIDLDGRFLYLDGTLVFNNAADIDVNAKVIGAGRIVLAGVGKVNFKDVSVFDGAIDVEGNDDAAIGGLWGVASVTNSVPEKGTLCVSGTSEYGFFGSVLDGVNLAVSGALLVGCGADVSKDSSLILKGGEVTFLKQMEFAGLFGYGDVSGSSITVSGAVQPTAEGHEDAIVFEYPPVFLNGVPDGWSLHRHDDGMALRLAYGTTVVIR